MNASLDPKLQQQLTSHGQEHVLKFWDQLDADQQSSLSDTLAKVDFAQLDELFNKSFSESSWAELAASAEVPPARTLEDFADGASFIEARQRVSKFFAAGKSRW